MNLPRLTPAGPALVRGAALFTGRPAACIIRPAEAGEGLAFIRTDLPGRPRIPAHIDNLGAPPVHPAFAAIPPRHTALHAPDRPEAVVYTTEHVLGALVGLGITDATVELDGPEPPIGDGSALPFADALAAAGVRASGAEIEPLAPAEPVTVSDGRASITAEPVGEGEPASFTYALDYGPGAPIRPHEATCAPGAEAFARDIAPARTFSLAAEAAQMRALGLFQAFSPRDLLVIDDAGIPIENAWRHPDEPARHKLLDLLGDLALVGRPVHARVVATRAGHALNHALARALVGGGA
jgi:UDP-3-O-acyl N-acetylglucosamine deacetylase